MKWGQLFRCMPTIDKKAEISSGNMDWIENRDSCIQYVRSRNSRRVHDQGWSDNIDHALHACNAQSIIAMFQWPEFILHRAECMIKLARGSWHPCQHFFRSSHYSLTSEKRISEIFDLALYRCKTRCVSSSSVVSHRISTRTAIVCIPYITVRTDSCGHSEKCCAWPPKPQHCPHRCARFRMQVNCRWYSYSVSVARSYSKMIALGVAGEYLYPDTFSLAENTHDSPPKNCKISDISW